jgi:hypothetical protein
MAKADIEISSRTIIALILFIILAVIIIGLGILMASNSSASVNNLTNIAEAFKP